MEKEISIDIHKLHDFFNVGEEEVVKAADSLQVLTKDGFKKVSYLYKTNERCIVKITLYNGQILKGAYGHKVMTKDFGYKELDKINVNDIVVINGNGFVTVVGKEYLTYKENCFDLQVPSNHNYITNSIVSHNTEVFFAILNMLDSPSLVLFNRQQLAHQTLERAKVRGLDVGIVQGGNVEEKRITMATIQSAHKIEKISYYKNLILDEAHNTASKSYQKVIKLKHWERVYGFSATPVNPNKMDLKSAKIIANVGPVICDVNPKGLMEKGLIAKPKIIMVPIDRPEDMEDFNYREAETAGIVNNKYRNKIIAKLAEKHRGDGILILNKYVDQGRNIAKLIPDAPFIWNEVSLEDRLKVVAKFDNGDIDILIASRILDEGIDIRNFKVLIIASAGLSFVKTIQRLGRGLRVTSEKKSILVYDFIDNTNSKLLKHSKARVKTYKMFGYDDITEMEDSSALI